MSIVTVPLSILPRDAVGFRLNGQYVGLVYPARACPACFALVTHKFIPVTDRPVCRALRSVSTSEIICMTADPQLSLPVGRDREVVTVSHKIFHRWFLSDGL